MASAYSTQYRILRREWCYKKILCPVGIISSDGAWPCFLLYSFLLHSFILSPLQYWLMNPLQAKSLTSPYFLKKPHVVNFSHSWAIYHSLTFMLQHMFPCTPGWNRPYSHWGQVWTKQKALRLRSCHDKAGNYESVCHCHDLFSHQSWKGAQAPLFVSFLYTPDKHYGTQKPHKTLHKEKYYYVRYLNCYLLF